MGIDMYIKDTVYIKYGKGLIMIIVIGTITLPYYFMIPRL